MVIYSYKFILAAAASSFSDEILQTDYIFIVFKL